MYVTIQISKEQAGYEPIQQFISIKTSHIKSHRELEGRCFFDDEDENDTAGPSPPPKLRLFPCKYIKEKKNERKLIVYLSISK